MRGPKLALVVALVASGCHGHVEDGEPEAAALPSGIEPSAVLPSIEPAVEPPSVELRAAPAGTGMAALDALPWDERLGLEQALAASDARYAPRMDEGGPVLETPGSAVATFSATGARLAFGGHEATLRVAAVGREGAMRPASVSGASEIVGAEVRTARLPGVVEWWRSLPSGLEHGITIAERPSGEGELRVEVAVTGDLSARALSTDAIELRDAAGARVATYAHLVVLDAVGARMPARMSVDGGRITLAIDDGAAPYPLVIDPLVTAQEATLLAPDGAANDQFGSSVALSADGTRALVGVPSDDTTGGPDAGSARVFLRTGTTWAQEATLLGAAWSLALSADGDCALVGARTGGSARVFLRTGTTWGPATALVASGDDFGYSVALSADGSRALVGAIGDDTVRGSNTGSAHVFLRSGSTWPQEATLLAPDGATNDFFGWSVALSSDGSRAIVGVPEDDTAGGGNAGSARVFLRTGTTWAHEATMLAPDAVTFDLFGWSVALSADGSRALVGVPSDDTPAAPNAGSTRVFLRTGTTWVEEATLLAPAGGAGDLFGWSVALTFDGSSALVGARWDDTPGGGDAGSAHVFLRTGTAWAQEGALLAPEGAAGDELGWSVALSSDGGHALVGAYLDDTTGGANAGSARVFTIALAPNGSTCGGDAVCVSGFCTDGVCCSARCAGGPSDCQACSAALTGGADGACAPLSAAAAPTVTCRAATVVCDVAETCTSASTLCPADAFAPTSTVCRAAAPDCDVAETCTGTSAACPTDGFAATGTACSPPSAGSCEVTAVCTGASATCPANGPALFGTICRAAATACDGPETCDGAATACAADSPATAGTTCRASAGVCDTAELCDGSSFACPGDVLLPSGSACRVAAGLCDLEEVCTGASPVCPGDVLAAGGLVCRPPTAGGCDVGETCTGLLAACPGDLFAPSTTACGPAMSGICDAPDHCTGTSGDCEAVFLVGTECRASSGACDAPEMCGSAPACPPDVVVSAGLSCRASSDPLCDPEEMCDGVAVACPADVTMCVARPDAGPVDSGPRSDGGVAADAGTPPVAAEGCACHVAPSRAPVPALLGAMVAFAALSGRRRRR